MKQNKSTVRRFDKDGAENLTGAGAMVAVQHLAECIRLDPQVADCWTEMGHAIVTARLQFRKEGSSDEQERAIWSKPGIGGIRWEDLARACDARAGEITAAQQQQKKQFGGSTGQPGGAP